MVMPWAAPTACAGSPRQGSFGAPTVAALLRDVSRRFPCRSAVVGPDGSKLTYAELLARAEKRAAALLAHGVRPGDRVAAWLDDGMDYIELYTACALGGFVVVPCNSRFTVGEVEVLLADSDPAVLVYSSVRAHLARDLAGRVGVPLALDADHERSGFADLLAGQACAPAADSLRPVRRDDLYILAYTSGTTGRPKGAMLTHAAVAAITRLNADSYRLPDHSVMPLTGSMSFVSVVPAHILTHFAVAGTVILPGPWTIDSLAETIRRHRATFVYVPSPLILEFAVRARKDPGALASVVTVLHSGSRSAPAHLGELVDAVGARLCEGWGMTENSGGLITRTVPEDFAPEANLASILTSVGRAAADTAVEVMDPEGRPLPHDGKSVGELAFRSPAMTTGYWRRPADTARAVRDGMLFTGDLGSIDAQGHVRISDRRTDLIVSGGMNVYPSEVEDCIRTLAGVTDVGVVGLPHPRWGSTVVAAVVLRSGVALRAQDVVDHCRAHLASYKKPTQVVFVAALPRTTSLKLSRAALREQLRGAAS
jgi:fatty-acyl-CoA synthase